MKILCKFLMFEKLQPAEEVSINKMAIMQIFEERRTLQFPSRSNTFIFIRFDSQLKFLSSFSQLRATHEKTSSWINSHECHRRSKYCIKIFTLSIVFSLSFLDIHSMIHCEFWTLNDTYCFPRAIETTCEVE